MCPPLSTQRSLVPYLDREARPIVPFQQLMVTDKVERRALEAILGKCVVNTAQSVLVPATYSVCCHFKWLTRAEVVCVVGKER